MTTKALCRLPAAAVIVGPPEPSMVIVPFP
jgi:hypothetical protein